MKSKPKKKAKPAAKRKPQPEPRAAAPEMAHAEEVAKTPDLPAGGVTEEELDEEVESIGDGTEEGDDMPPEVDEDDDEGYF